MRKAKMALAALCGLLLWSGCVRAAGVLGDVFRQVDNARWGVRQDAVRNVIARTLVDEQGIIAISWRLAADDCTANLLFNKDGNLYNLAWFANIPVADIQHAEKLEQEIGQDLQARYGKPAYAFSDGSTREAAKVAREAPQKAQERKKLAEELKEKKRRGKISEKEAKADLARLMRLAPSIFYSKMAFWDAGPVWAYTNLLCSTDGACYLHLQFVSKELTRGENYSPSPDKAFSYSPLDRDQDLVTRANRSLQARRNQNQDQPPPPAQSDAPPKTDAKPKEAKSGNSTSGWRRHPGKPPFYRRIFPAG